MTIPIWVNMETAAGSKASHSGIDTVYSSDGMVMVIFAFKDIAGENATMIISCDVEADRIAIAKTMIQGLPFDVVRRAS